MSEETKVNRVLSLYTKLLNGQLIYKSEEAIHYHVARRTIQRDIEDIRKFLDYSVADTGIVNTILYDREKDGYYLEQTDQMRFSNSEILAICKILLASRAFTKKEMSEMLAKLIDCCVPEANQRRVRDLVRNEEYHYIELCHKSVFVDKMWDIGQAVHENRYIEICYLKQKNKEVVQRRLKPVAIIFLDFYFYVAAFIEDEKVRQNFKVMDDVSPTMYRIDRIRSYEVLDEHFHIPYNERFEEGEFRKRIQFMYGGPLRRVTFKYLGLNVEAVLDRLPTAKILDEEEGIYTISAEVFGGEGMDMWLRSQGEAVEVVK